MKSPTIRALELLDEALTKVQQAEQNLITAAALEKTWLLFEAKKRTQEAAEVIKIAGGYVSELVESEIGSEVDLR